MTHSHPDRPAGDRAAILLAGLCAVHCLLLPLVVPMLPWLALLTENDTTVHRWLLLAIVPVSVFALARGCARHRRLSVFSIGVCAVALLLVAPFAEFLPPRWEQGLTLIGSAALSISHLLNLQAIRRAQPRLLGLT
ncbi:hypothetical protein B1810_07825 [Panacagrimonas perspica]|nr:hypothetical protein B1810_07825 [Panacagrimonas perspica]